MTETRRGSVEGGFAFGRIPLLLLILIAGFQGIATSGWSHASFAEPVKLTDGSEKFQLSRNPSKAMSFDSHGRLHITYWAGGFATNPTTPSAVYYQNWTVQDGWSAREFIDDSFYDTGSGLVKYGGRHPSLAITPDDTVWVAWHDHRHCNPDPPGNGIDNIEIFADRRPANGSFSSTDLRLTTTSAAHFGDNAYTPRIVARPDGGVSVLWYDFHVGGNVSDIYVKHSDSSGNFDLAEPILSMRITNQDDRPGNAFTKPAYSIPDFACDGIGNLFGIWTSGFGGAAPVYFAEVPRPTAIASETTIATSTGAYFDPAKITVADNNDLWVSYTARSGAEEDIYTMRRPSNSTIWDAPIALRATPGVAEKAVDLAVDSTGLLHFVWIDKRSGTHVYYGQMDPSGPQLLEQIQVTTNAGNYQRATLVLDGDDRPHLLFDSEDSLTNSGDVWFVAPLAPSSVSDWSRYK